MCGFDESSISEAIAEAIEVNFSENGVEVETASYREAGVLTMNAGFVISLPDGTEYQVTVVET